MTHALLSRGFGAERSAVEAANMLLFGQCAVFFAASSAASKSPDLRPWCAAIAIKLACQQRISAQLDFTRDGDVEDRRWILDNPSLDLP